MIAKGDRILFLDDGVMHLAGESGSTVVSGFTDCSFSVEDLEARGLLELARTTGVSIVGDADFPDLLRKHSFCLTWK